MQSAPCAPGQAPGFYVCVYSATSCKLVLLTMVQIGRDAVDLLLTMCEQSTQRYTGALSYLSIIVCRRLPYFNPVWKFRAQYASIGPKKLVKKSTWKMGKIN